MAIGLEIGNAAWGNIQNGTPLKSNPQFGRKIKASFGIQKSNSNTMAIQSGCHITPWDNIENGFPRNQIFIRDTKIDSHSYGNTVRSNEATWWNIQE